MRSGRTARQVRRRSSSAGWTSKSPKLAFNTPRSAPGSPYLPDQHGAMPAQIRGVDPRAQLELAVHDDMGAIGRIDRDVIRRKFGAPHISQWRAVTGAPFAGDNIHQ